MYSFSLAAFAFVFDIVIVVVVVVVVTAVAFIVVAFSRPSVTSDEVKTSSLLSSPLHLSSSRSANGAVLAMR